MKRDNFAGVCALLAGLFGSQLAASAWLEWPVRTSIVFAAAFVVACTATIVASAERRLSRRIASHMVSR